MASLKRYAAIDGTKNITANGTYDVANNASVAVSVPNQTTTKSITQNGTYTPTSPYIGFSQVTVNVSGGGGGGGSEDLVGLIARTITSISNGDVKSIGSYAFYYCTSLTTASFPACTSIGDGAFYYCSSLTTASFPACTNISSYAFYYCTSLTTASFPACTTIGSYAFGWCASLTTVSFPACTSIGSSAFTECYSLTTASFPACTTIGSRAFGWCARLVSLYLTGSSLCSLLNSNAFSSTPIGGYSTTAGRYGSIYVPASLLTQYKAATNWTYFSSRFVGI